MIERNNIALGLMLGAITPVVGFVMFEYIFEILTHFGLMEEITVSASPRRERTIALLAICANLIPFTYTRKNKLDNTMRGVVFTTLVYTGFWIYQYRAVIF